MEKKTIRQPKKILYIITKSVWGGAQKYVFDLAVNLPRDKFKVVIAGSEHGVMAEKLKAAGLSFLEIKSFQRDINFFKEIISFFEILFILFKTKPDIVHVSSSKAGGVAGVADFFYLLIKKAAMLFRMTSPYDREGETILPLSYNTLTIFTVHGWAFLEQRPKWQNWLIKFFSKLTCLFYDRIICVSENDYKMGLKYKIAPAKKMVIIHNGINSDDYNFLDKERARRNVLTYLKSDIESRYLISDALWIGTIGEFTKNKGQHYLIEAIKSLQLSIFNFQFILMGFDGGEKNNLESQIKNQRLNNNVFLTDNLPGAANYLKAFDVFVLPSLKEGLPYTILEAGLAKLPVIASNVGGIPEIINPSTGTSAVSSVPNGSGQAGILVQPADSTAITNAIKKLIDNPDLRERLANNLHQKITREFTLAKMLNATIAAYENLIIDTRLQ